MAVAMGTTQQVLQWINKLLAADCEIKMDLEAGTAEALDDGQPVFRALQKGYQQPWIIRFLESNRIRWQ